MATKVRRQTRSRIYRVNGQLRAANAKAASRFLDKRYGRENELTVFEARTAGAAGEHIIGIMRRPIDRIESAWRGRRYGPEDLPNFFKNGKRNVHMIPQAEWARIQGWPITEWEDFEVAVGIAPTGQPRPAWPRGLRTWFNERYAEDIEIYEGLTWKKSDK